MVGWRESIFLGGIFCAWGRKKIARRVVWFTIIGGFLQLYHGYIIRQIMLTNVTKNTRYRVWETPETAKYAKRLT